MTYKSRTYREPKNPVGTVAELFAGVGGFRIGLARAGWKTVYSNPEELEDFQKQWASRGLTLDMGKSCIRFRRLEDLHLDLIAQVLQNKTPEQALHMVTEARSRRRPRSKRESQASTTTEATPPLGLNVALGSGAGSEADTGFNLLVRAISMRMMWASRRAN